jgi:hypothetical protein
LRTTFFAAENSEVSPVKFFVAVAVPLTRRARRLIEVSSDRVVGVAGDVQQNDARTVATVSTQLEAVDHKAPDRRPPPITVTPFVKSLKVGDTFAPWSTALVPVVAVLGEDTGWL